MAATAIQGGGNVRTGLADGLNIVMAGTAVTDHSDMIKHRHRLPAGRRMTSITITARKYMSNWLGACAYRRAIGVTGHARMRRSLKHTADMTRLTKDVFMLSG